MKKIISINYFKEVIDIEGLEERKAREAYGKVLETVRGDWEFAQLQDRLESYFTSYVPVAESTDDTIVYDYAITSEYGITLYIRDNNGSIPVARFKFDNASLADSDRSLTPSELEIAKYIIETEHLDGVVA